jgi:hypothetical protein
LAAASKPKVDPQAAALSFNRPDLAKAHPFGDGGAISFYERSTNFIFPVIEKFR